MKTLSVLGSLFLVLVACPFWASADEPDLLRTLSSGRILAMLATIPDSALDRSYPVEGDLLKMIRRHDRGLASEETLPLLMVLIGTGEFDAAAYLVGRGCDVNAKTPSGRTAVAVLSLRTNLQEDEAKLLDLLLATGADPTIGKMSAEPPFQREDAVYFAYRHLNVRAVDLLLQYSFAPPPGWPAEAEDYRPLHGPAHPGSSRQNSARNWPPRNAEQRVIQINRLIATIPGE